MKYKLINQPNPNYSGLQQVLANRKVEDFYHYVNTTDNDINNAESLSEEALKLAATKLILNINNDERVLIVIDCDCDGYTSAALLTNYLHDLFPSYVENKIDFHMHNGKQHGLSDCIDKAKNYKLVICPDSSSNDFDLHKELYDQGTAVIVLDHHDAEKISPYAIVINNQLSDYPNKDLSGVGVTWQFCRYLDKILNKNYANEYLDLVAVGDMGDMMSMLSIETKHLINIGLKPENIKNPFIFEMWQKNRFKLGENITPMGAAFYIVPFINAICRSGTLEEKQLIFASMVKHFAFNEVPSNKRGHKLGEMERVVDQAIRTCTNVKNRQTRAQDEGMEKLENLIAANDMMQHKVLLFLLEPGEVDPNIRGLIANKIMAKYQRPVAVLTKVVEEALPWNDIEETRISYQGSARGCDKVDVRDFKHICSCAPGTIFAEGHAGAFGLGIYEGSPDEGAAEVYGDGLIQFLDYTDEVLKDMPNEPIYYVDYIFTENDEDAGDKIIEIANMANYWGKDFDEALVCVEHVKVYKNMITVMKSNTLKITLPNGISMIKFSATDEEIANLTSEGYVEINVIAKCNANEWCGNISPQLMIEDYEIIKNVGWVF